MSRLTNCKIIRNVLLRRPSVWCSSSDVVGREVAHTARKPLCGNREPSKIELRNMSHFKWVTWACVLEKNEIKERVSLWSRRNMTQAVFVDLVPDDLHVGGHGILWQKSNIKLNQIAPLNQKRNGVRKQRIKTTYRFLHGQWISLQLEKEVPLILLLPYRTIVHEVPLGQKFFLFNLEF